MTKKYAREPTSKKCAKAQSTDVRAHFKNTYECAKMLKGKTLKEAREYYEAVLDHKRCVPFTKFNGCIGRTAQAKEFKLTQGRWPEKSIKVLQSLLINLEANAIKEQLDITKLRIGHIQVNQAQKGRRRTYRAHGRVTPYLSSPCHIEIWAVEEQENVTKADDKAGKVYSLKKQAKNTIRRFLKVGGDKQ